MDYLTESLYACLGGLQHSCLQPIIPWKLSDSFLIGSREFSVLRQIGEGGYSFVYLVRDTETSEEFAVKKVLTNEPDQLRLVEQEVSLMRNLQHPNLLPLLDSAFEKSISSNVTTVYMLFPLYECGTLYEEITRRAEMNQPLPLQEVLSIFVQVCKGVCAMHGSKPSLAHRDIKPHNVLLRPIEESGQAGTNNHDTISQEPGDVMLERGMQSRYHAVLMDFGSTREAHVKIMNRSEAVKLQEDAEAHCSAPYRAPELFDVPSQCVMDGKMDVWSLGCLLYFMMFAVSPFERVLGEAGGSLALAVANGEIRWSEPGETYDPAPFEEIKKLASMCLTVDPVHRPNVKQVLLLAGSLRQSF